jgi:hypothetical protein
MSLCIPSYKTNSNNKKRSKCGTTAFLTSNGCDKNSKIDNPIIKNSHEK